MDLLEESQRVHNADDGKTQAKERDIRSFGVCGAKKICAEKLLLTVLVAGRKKKKKATEKA